MNDLIAFFSPFLCRRQQQKRIRTNLLFRFVIKLDEILKLDYFDGGF